MNVLPESRRALVRDLDRRIRTLPSWKPVLHADTPPEWYGRLLTSYSLLADDEPTVYLTGELAEDEGHIVGHLVAFTDTLLVRAKVWGSESVKISVTAAPRSGLVLLAASGSASATDEDAAAAWPGDLTFTLTYGHESDALALPLDIPDDPEWAAEQVALLSGLRADLGAGN